MKTNLDLCSFRGSFSSVGALFLILLTFTGGVAQGAVTQAWVQRYHGIAITNNLNYATELAVDHDGNVVVTGQSRNSTGADYDYYTAKYAAANGALIWERRFNSPANGDDEPTALALDTNGNAVVTGYSYNGLNYEFYTAKYAAANGALLWERRYNGPGGDDLGIALALDSSGNAIVTGSSWNGANYDYYTAKYAAGTGAVLWEQRYDGHRDDWPSAIALDASGNVIIAGYPEGEGTGPDYQILKYAAVDGALLWQARYSNSVFNGSDFTTAVAVDGDGNVAVTGISYSGPGTPDFFTAKYAAANGALIWQQRFHGSADSADLARRIAVDNLGNVVVAGEAVRGSYDFYVIKYAAADGAVLWEQRYNAGGSDRPSGLSLDSNGNVYVTGSSEGANGIQDYATVKYDANGNQIWVARYDHSSGSDVAFALGLDSGGNVFVTGFSDAEFATIKYVQTAEPGFPSITIDPRSQTVLVGSNATFTVAATGTAPLTYQWFFNGLRIALATNSTFNISNVNRFESGECQVVVSNSVGYTLSSLARLTVLTPPFITNALFSQHALAGGTASFEVRASGDSPLTYQWRFNGNSISNATNATATNAILTLTNLQLAQTGDYSVQVTNPYGSTNSPPAHLTVDPLLIVREPSDEDSFEGDDVLFDVIVGSTVPVTYQWRFNGQPITGATNSSLLLKSIRFADVGSYSVAVTNSFGGTTSRDASLVVLALFILYQPENQSVVAGDSAFFVVNAQGHWPLSFQWYFNGKQLIGATNYLLTLNNVQLSDAGSYRVVVTNQFSAVTSAVAQLEVEFPGPLDSWSSPATPTSLDLFGITYGRGIFVAVGYDGVVLTSANGVTWTNQTVSSNDLHGVNYGNGLFVAVGQLGTILTSLDGIVWTNRASGTSAFLDQVAYGNGVYVIVGDDGVSLSSPDGITWTTNQISTTKDLNAIAFGNGRFVAGGDGKSIDSVILSSTNGANWTFEHSHIEENRRGGTYGGGMFILVGNDGTILRATQPDQWVDAANGCLTTNNLRGVTYGNGSFATVGNIGTILTSYDGALWKCKRSGTTNNLHSVAYGNGTFVAVGNAGTIVRSGSFLPGRLAVRSAPNAQGFELTLRGDIGRTYRLQANSNLATTNWIDLSTFNNLQSASTLFLDQSAPNFLQRFYRLLSP